MLLVATIVLAVAALVSFLVYHRIDKTQLIEYTESGDIDYRVQYKENEFFPDEWIGKEQLAISNEQLAIGRRVSRIALIL